MNFGDILNKWDHMTGSAANSAAGKPGETESAKRSDVMTEWLRKNPVYDKDSVVDPERARQDRISRRRRLLRKKPDGSIDLHGKTRDEAWAALEAFFDEARRQGWEKVLVIHGKATHTTGEPVLDRMCRQFIEQCPFAGENGYADSSLGGRGATWVLLKEASPLEAAKSL